jgi:urea carboxylase
LRRGSDRLDHAERERWRQSGQLTFDSEPAENEREPQLEIPAGATAITSPVTGNVWQISSAVGQRVNEGDELLVMEAMKMEIPVVADQAGEIVEIRCEAGKAVNAGDIVVVMK